MNNNRTLRNPKPQPLKPKTKHLTMPQRDIVESLNGRLGKTKRNRDRDVAPTMARINSCLHALSHKGFDKSNPYGLGLPREMFTISWGDSSSRPHNCTNKFVPTCAKLVEAIHELPLLQFYLLALNARLIPTYHIPHIPYHPTNPINSTNCHCKECNKLVV